MRSLVIVCLLLSACTINVVDNRFTREEVLAAFAERDEMIGKLAVVIDTMQKEKKSASPTRLEKK